MWFKTAEGAEKYKESVIKRKLFDSVVSSKDVSKGIADLLAVYFQSMFRRYFRHDAYFGDTYDSVNAIVIPYSHGMIYKVSAEMTTKENKAADSVDIEEVSAHISDAMKKMPLLNDEVFKIRIAKVEFMKTPLVCCPEYVTAAVSLYDVSDDNLMTVGLSFSSNDSLKVSVDRVENRVFPCNVVTFSFNISRRSYLESYRFGM